MYIHDVRLSHMGETSSSSGDGEYDFRSACTALDGARKKLAPIAVDWKLIGVRWR